MNKRKKNDELIIRSITIAIIILIIGAAVIGISKSQRKEDFASLPELPTQSTPVNTPEDYNAPASIDPIDLPEDLEATIGFEPHQLQTLTDHYALTKYEIGQNSIIYYYQTAAATSGERFIVICTKQSEDDYLSSIPTKNITHENYGGIDLTYSERWLYSVPNTFEMIEPIQNGIDEGTMEIEYGNDIEEVIKKNCFYWYDDGIKYEIQVRNQNLPYETLLDIARKIIDAQN